MAKARSPEEKARALEVVAEHGIAEAHRQTGIPKTTLSGWASAAGVQTDHEKMRAAHEAAQERIKRLRDEVRLKLAERAVELLDRINASHEEFVGKDGRRETVAHATPEGTRNYMVAVGIAIDKLRLELGEVTDRTEQVSKSDFDREVAELVEKVRQNAPVNGNGSGH